MNNYLDHKASRRQLLKHMGAAGLAMALPGAAMGLPPPPHVKRVVFVYVPGGAPAEDWMPKGCQDRFTLGSVSAPLEPVKQHCVFFDDITLEKTGHGFQIQALGGEHLGTETVDVRLGKLLQGDAPLASVHLASPSAEQYMGEAVSVCETGPCRFEYNPFLGYQDLFAQESDRAYIDKNLPAFSRSFNNNPDNTQGDGDFDRNTDLNIELACLALHMDKTRVVTLMFGGMQTDIHVPELGHPTPYHQAMHTESGSAYHDYRTYLTRKVSHLIQLLEATRDIYGRNLLDNTIVVQVADMGDGREHSGERAPFMLAGGRNMLHTGLYLREVGSVASVLDTVSTAVGFPEVNIGAGPIEHLIKADFY